MTDTLGTKTLWSATASVVGVLARVTCSILIARLLGPDGVGRIAYVVWMVEMTGLVVQLGLGQSLTRYLAELHGSGRGEEARALTGWIAVRYAALTVLGAAAVVSLGPGVASDRYGPSLWLLAGVLFLAKALETLYRAELAGQQRFDRLARVNTLAGLVWIAGVAFGALRYGVEGALAGHVAGALLPALLGLGLLARRGARPGPVLLKRLRRHAIFTWLAAILSAFVWARMELLFLERYWDAHEVAMFSVGLTLASVVTMGPTLLGAALMPHFAGLSGGADSASIRTAYATATRLMAFLLFPACLGAAAIVPALLPLLYGPGFEPAIPNAMVLVAFSSLAFSGVASSLVYGLDRPHFVALSGFVGALAAVPLFLLVVPAHGAWGAAWVRSGLQVALVSWGLFYVARKLRCGAPVRALARTAAASVVCGAAAWASVRLVPGPASILAAVPVGALVYVLSVRLLGVLHPEDERELQRLAARLRPRLRRPASGLIAWLGGAR